MSKRKTAIKAVKAINETLRVLQTEKEATWMPYKPDEEYSKSVNKLAKACHSAIENLVMEIEILNGTAQKPPGEKQEK